MPSSDRSVSTVLHSNRKRSRTKMFLKKWSLPAVVLVVTTFCVVSHKNQSRSRYLWTHSLHHDEGHYEPARSLRFSPTSEKDSLERRRQLATPYNQDASTALPAWTNNIDDIWATLTASSQPFFWYIPKGGGSTIVKLFAYCLGLSQASNKGVYTQQTSNLTLGVWQIGNPTRYPFIPQYVNVQTETEPWLDICAARQVAEQRVADVFVTQHVAYAASNVFSTTTKGRLVAMFRHPVKRIVDQFYYRQHATWEPTFDAQLASMSLDNFSISEKMIENFETKSLLGLTGSADVTAQDVLTAKEILRRKVLVLIFEWYDVSIVRMEKYFGWWYDLNVMKNYTINNCHYDFIKGGDHQGNHPMVPHSEQTYNYITVRNWADMELYHYAKGLFSEQAKLLDMI